MVASIARRSSFIGTDRVIKALRIGVSLTGLVLAGTGPAMAQVLDLGGAVISRDNLDSALAVPLAGVSNGILRLSPPSALTYAGGFDDSLGVFALTKLGPRSLTLTGSGRSSFSGATTVANGQIIAGAADVLSPNSVLAFTSATASVDLNGFSQTIAGLSGGGAVRNGGGAAVLTLGKASFSGVISGATQVVTTGTGVVSFSGANTYTGGTTVQGGTLRYVDDAAFGTGAIRFTAASTLVAANPGRDLGNAIRLDANIVAGSDGVSTVLSGVISGAGGLTKTGRAILALANPSNSFGGGFSLQQGSVAIGGNGSLGTGVFSTGPLQTTLMLTGNFSVVVANAISVGHLLNFELPDAAQSVTLDGVISGAGGLYLKTGAGTLILNNANTYAGVTQMGSGIVGIGNANALGGGTSNVSHGGGTGIAAYAPDLVLANDIRGQDGMTIDTRGYDMTMTGVLSNKREFVGSIDKIGNGVLTLSGANTFTGTAMVTAGELHLTGSLASDVVVASGATLSGAGMLAAGRSAAIGDGAILSPGFGAAGTLTFGNLRLSNASVLKFDLTTPAVGGAGNDLIIVGNDLILDGILRINTQPGFRAGTYRIIDYAGTLTNNLLVGGDSVPNFRYTIDTATPGQVNLLVRDVVRDVVRDGVQSFAIVGDHHWDGNNFTADGVISGGTGTWNTANTNWTDATGAGQAPWSGTTGSFGVAGGTVSIVGVQAFERLAFTADGYVLQGDALAPRTNGIIDVAPAATTVINSRITGAGSIAKAGAGNLVLGGGNSFAGLAIGAGTVTLGTDTAAGVGEIGIGNAALAAGVSGLVVGNRITVTGAGFVDSGAGVFTLGGAIAGPGGITKTGSGVLVLTGIGSQGGATTVSAGRLHVTGSIAASATTVQAATVLSGTGTTGALTALSGSAVSPGAVAGGVGTLAVNGNVSLAAGSSFIVDVAPALGADRLAASGTAAIAGDIVITPAAGKYSFGDAILVSSSARTGTFANTAIGGSFGPSITASLVYTPTLVLLRMAPASLVATGGTLTGNALAVAAAFDAAVAKGDDPAPFVALYTQGPALSNTLGQLAGELHAAGRRVMMEDTRVVRETAFDRLNAGFQAVPGAQSVTTAVGDAATTVWLRGAGSWGTAKGDSVGSRFTTEQIGVLTGVDHARGGIRVGAMFHHLRTDIDFAALGSSKVTSTGGAVYGGYRADGGGLAIGLGGGFAGTDASGVRGITATGFAGSLTSDFGGKVWQVFGEAGYDLFAASDRRAEPFVRVAHVQVRTDGFAEAGGLAALTLPAQRSDLTLTTLGLRGGFDLGAAVVSASAGWQRAGGDLSALTHVGITGLNSQASIRAAALDRDAAAIEVQARFGLGANVALGVGYSGIIGANNRDHGGRATLTIGF